MFPSERLLRPGDDRILKPPAQVHKVSTVAGHPDKEIRKKRYKLLTESGVIVQSPDGRLKAVSSEEATKRLEEMKPEDRALYEEI